MSEAGVIMFWVAVFIGMGIGVALGYSACGADKKNDSDTYASILTVFLLVVIVILLLIASWLKGIDTENKRKALINDTSITMPTN